MKSMREVNLDTYSLSLLTAKEDILNPRSSTNWALFAYDGIMNRLKLADSGVGGLKELSTKLHPMRPLYGMCRVGTAQPCIVMILWVGNEVDEYCRAECASHLPAIKNFFKEVHIFLPAHTLDEITEERICTLAYNAAAVTKGPRGRPGRRMEDRQAIVGTNYKRTIAAAEIQRIQRDSFWAQAEREEEERKKEEQRRAAEDRRQRERERMLQEKREAIERDRRLNEKEQKIKEQRRIQAKMDAEAHKQEKLKWEHQEREREEEETRARYFRSESEEKSSETAALVSQRVANTREFFRQLSSTSVHTASSPSSPVRGPYRQLHRSQTDSVFSFNESPSSPPASPYRSSLLSPYFQSIPTSQSPTLFTNTAASSLQNCATLSIKSNLSSSKIKSYAVTAAGPVPRLEKQPPSTYANESETETPIGDILDSLVFYPPPSTAEQLITEGSEMVDEFPPPPSGFKNSPELVVNQPETLVDPIDTPMSSLPPSSLLVPAKPPARPLPALPVAPRMLKDLEPVRDFTARASVIPTVEEEDVEEKNEEREIKDEGKYVPGRDGERRGQEEGKGGQKEEEEHDGTIMGKHESEKESNGKRMEKRESGKEQDGKMLEERESGKDKDGKMLEERKCGKEEDGKMLEERVSGKEEDGKMLEEWESGKEQDGKMGERESGKEEDGKMLEERESGKEEDGKMLEERESGKEEDGKMLEERGSGKEEDGKMLEERGSGKEEDGKMLEERESGKEENGKMEKRESGKEEDGEMEERESGKEDGKMEERESGKEEDGKMEERESGKEEDGKMEELESGKEERECGKQEDGKMLEERECGKDQDGEIMEEEESEKIQHAKIILECVLEKEQDREITEKHEENGKSLKECENEKMMEENEQDGKTMEAFEAEKYGEIMEECGQENKQYGKKLDVRKCEEEHASGKEQGGEIIEELEVDKIQDGSIMEEHDIEKEQDWEIIGELGRTKILNAKILLEHMRGKKQDGIIVEAFDSKIEQDRKSREVFETAQTQYVERMEECGQENEQDGKIVEKREDEDDGKIVVKHEDRKSPEQHESENKQDWKMTEDKVQKKIQDGDIIEEHVFETEQIQYVKIMGDCGQENEKKEKKIEIYEEEYEIEKVQDLNIIQSHGDEEQDWEIMESEKIQNTNMMLEYMREKEQDCKTGESLEEHKELNWKMTEECGKIMEEHEREKAGQGGMMEKRQIQDNKGMSRVDDVARAVKVTVLREEESYTEIIKRDEATEEAVEQVKSDHGNEKEEMNTPLIQTEESSADTLFSQHSQLFPESHATEPSQFNDASIPESISSTQDKNEAQMSSSHQTNLPTIQVESDLSNLSIDDMKEKTSESVDCQASSKNSPDATFAERGPNTGTHVTVTDEQTHAEAKIVDGTDGSAEGNNIDCETSPISENQARIGRSGEREGLVPVSHFLQDPDTAIGLKHCVTPQLDLTNDIRDVEEGEEAISLIVGDTEVEQILKCDSDRDHDNEDLKHKCLQDGKTITETPSDTRNDKTADDK
ncbi:hypothetical protein R3I94_016546 [Phoxinus phoxinus]